MDFGALCERHPSLKGNIAIPINDGWRPSSAKPAYSLHSWNAKPLLPKMCNGAISRHCLGLNARDYFNSTDVTWEQPVQRWRIHYCSGAGVD
jgi:hypothetical protein